MSTSFNLNDRHFILAGNSAAGDAPAGTARFHFRQEGDAVWATYQGGAIVLGLLLARADERGELDVRFQQLTAAGELKTGRGLSRVEVLPDARLRLRETWEFTSGATGGGEAVFEEIE
ncbi:MAG: n-acetylglutamate synthase [Acidobacteriota bacterium]|nr:n-acetylglutamate synthase [Acidobacteriota bacterium]